MTIRIRILDAVSHERLDDEVIAINLETGAYFAFEGAAAECWTAAHAGNSADEIATLLAAMFDVDRSTALADTQAFMAALMVNGLAVEVVGDATPSVPGAPPSGTRRPYEVPTVDAYDDLETLLLIDPIHEVDESGWPLPAPDAD